MTTVLLPTGNLGITVVHVNISFLGYFSGVLFQGEDSEYAV